MKDSQFSYMAAIVCLVGSLSAAAPPQGFLLLSMGIMIGAVGVRCAMMGK